MIEEPDEARRIRDGEEHDVLACAECDSTVFVITFDGLLACPDCGTAASLDLIADALKKRRTN